MEIMPGRTCQMKLRSPRQAVVIVMVVMIMGTSGSDVCAPRCPRGNTTDTTVTTTGNTPAYFTSSTESYITDGPAGNSTRYLTSDPSNCTQFYACEDAGAGVLAVGPYQCPIFEYFDDARRECLPIAEAPLGYCTSPCNPCTPACDTPGQVLPDPLNCTKYYVCLETGELLSLECDLGLQFDYAALECTQFEEEDLQCFSYCDTCDTYCTHEGELQPDPLDCSAYYLCDPPYKVHKLCPEGELFDPSFGVCSPLAFCDDSCVVY